MRQATYAKHEFLKALSTRGYPRTERWFEEWIQRGLLDKGTRDATTKGAMVYAWPQEQLEFATSLLSHVDRRVHLASLANVVVWIWLRWGDRYVPYRQVPRALLPWRAAEQEPAEVHVRAAARAVVAKLAHPRGTGRRRFARTLTEMTYARDVDVEQLREGFTDLFDSDRLGVERGPVGAQLSTDSYLRLVQLRTTALRA